MRADRGERRLEIVGIAVPAPGLEQNGVAHLELYGLIRIRIGVCEHVQADHILFERVALRGEAREAQKHGEDEAAGRGAQKQIFLKKCFHFAFPFAAAFFEQISLLFFVQNMGKKFTEYTFRSEKIPVYWLYRLQEGGSQ